MSAGMAYEAMNNAGHLKSRLIVVLNDNDMSSAPPVGAMSAYLDLAATKPIAASASRWERRRAFGAVTTSLAARSTPHLVTGGTFFEESASTTSVRSTATTSTASRVLRTPRNMTIARCWSTS
jgi:1-deoxy-D-xylulose-5-phosphate synthase